MLIVRATKRLLARLLLKPLIMAGDLFNFLTEKLPVLLALFISVGFSLFVLANYSRDTTTITNTAFVVMATLAAMAFSYSRSLNAKILRDRMLYVGERLFHSSILMIIASLLKYLLLLAAQIEGVKANEFLSSYIVVPLGSLVVIFFFYAALNAHTAIRIANDELWKRMRRHKDWNHLW